MSKELKLFNEIIKLIWTKENINKIKGEDGHAVAVRFQAWHEKKLKKLDKLYKQLIADTCEMEAYIQYAVKDILSEEEIYGDSCSVPMIEDIVDSLIKHEPKEECICAAVLDEHHNIIRGHRHSDCIQAILNRDRKMLKEEGAQGFITSLGRYVNRELGRKLQDAAGIESVSEDGYMGKTLFSEDLY